MARSDITIGMRTSGTVALPASSTIAQSNLALRSMVPLLNFPLMLQVDATTLAALTDQMAEIVRQSGNGRPLGDHLTQFLYVSKLGLYLVLGI